MTKATKRAYSNLWKLFWPLLCFFVCILYARLIYIHHHEQSQRHPEEISLGYPLEIEVVYHPGEVLRSSTGAEFHSGMNEYIFRNVGATPLEIHFPPLAIYYTTQKNVFNKFSDWPSFIKKHTIFTLSPGESRAFKNEGSSIIGSTTAFDWCFIFDGSNCNDKKQDKNSIDEKAEVYIGAVIAKGTNAKGEKPVVLKTGGEKIKGSEIVSENKKGK